MTLDPGSGLPDGLLVEDVDRLRIITLNRPEKRNALDLPMRSALTRLFDDARIDRSIGALVITGAGGTFCSGADVGIMARLEGSYARERVGIAQNIARSMAGCSKPVIAAVRGIAFGAGLGIALMADYLVAGQDARFSAGFINVGLGPDLGTSWSLPNRVGLARARRMMLQSEMVAADEALRIGLVDELVETDLTLESALTVARKLASLPPLAVGEIKSIMANRPTSLGGALEQEADLQVRLTGSDDFVEAFSAFQEKRSPHFTGK